MPTQQRVIDLAAEGNLPHHVRSCIKFFDNQSGFDSFRESRNGFDMQVTQYDVMNTHFFIDVTIVYRQEWRFFKLSQQRTQPVHRVMDLLSVFGCICQCFCPVYGFQIMVIQIQRQNVTNVADTFL